MKTIVAVFLLAAAWPLAAAVPVALLPDPKVYLTDNNGKPCSGCKLWSYAAGTTTPLATYTDSTGGPTNTNPVILDASGRANVWISSSLYKFVLETAIGSPHGTVLWSQDNVSSFTFTNIAVPVSVSNGGTGTASPLTGVLIGNGIGPFTAVPILPVSQGGTGDSSITGIPYGTGTSPLGQIALGPQLAYLRSKPNAQIATPEFAKLPFFYPSDYNFPAQTPGGALTASTPAIINLAPCPLGIVGGAPNTTLYISGGTGTAEVVPVISGTCVGDGISSGNVGFTPANSHSGAWTISSATAGIQESINRAASLTGGDILFGGGTYSIHYGITPRQGVSLKGSSAGGNAATLPISGEFYSTVIKSNITDPMVAMVTPELNWSNLIENITFDANGQTPTILNLIHNPRGAIFRDLLLTHTASGGTGIYMLVDPSVVTPPAQNHFERVFAVNMASKALIISGGTLNTFIDCDFASNGDDVVVINQQSDDNMFYGGIIFPQAGHTGVVLNYSGDTAGGFLNNFYGTAIQGAPGSTHVDASHNAQLSFFYGSYMGCCGTPYASTGGGGLVKFVDVQQNSTAGGYAASFSITPTGSPFTYPTAPLPYAVTVNVSLGTVSQVRINRNGTLRAVSTSGSFLLQPTDQIEVTYSSTPTMVGVPQ